MTDKTPIVLIHTYENGDVSCYVTGGDAVRLLFVDERAPNDRVYEHLSRCDEQEIYGILGYSTVGSSEDARHKALEHQIKSLLNGTPALTLVTGDEE